MRAIREYLPKDKEAFLANSMLQDAILMRLLAIGEEIAHLSDAFVEQHADFTVAQDCWVAQSYRPWLF